MAAGDSHCAGVIAGMAHDMGLSKATKLGNEVAAIVVGKPGQTRCRRSSLSSRAFIFHK
ncbi:hypothetical protein VQZ12_002804 [Salmonella enterica]|nr:hypothetical protein [Salmonella enterica subsp. salamae]EKC2494627.1 hypothetical protein [Salmonella enterica]EMD3916470.1 hypothetical protein [Salmonella enterica]